MAKLPEPLSWLSKAVLEDMCHNCGICCTAQVSVDKGINVLVPELRCKHLVTKSDGGEGEMCCSVYEDRHEVAKGWCFPLADALEKGLFPDLCPYVQDLKGYVGSKVLPDAEYAAIKPVLKKALSAKGKPEWASDEAWKTFLIDDDDKNETSTN